MDTARLWLTRQISAADLAADVTWGGEMERWGEDSEGDSFPAQHQLYQRRAFQYQTTLVSSVCSSSRGWWR